MADGHRRRRAASGSIVLDGFIRRIPVDSEEAGRIDRASGLQLLRQIVVQLLAPALIAVIPLVTVAVRLQRWLIDGLTTGAVK